MSKTQHQHAFTLAEVLITLSIIGVVAALTIPSLVAKNQEKETVVRVKKAYNTLTNVFNLAQGEYGDPTNWGIKAAGQTNSCENVGAIWGKWLSLAKNCGEQKGCLPENYKYLDGTKDGDINAQSAYTKFILTDGTIIAIESRTSDCTTIYGNGEQLTHVCAKILLDINGFKGPNISGRDKFDFYLTKYGIVPDGSVNNVGNSIASCNKLGFNCTAWVIFKENMDYLKGPVSWD